MADAKSIMNTVISPKLEESFGKTMATCINTRAIFAAMSAKTEKEKLKLMVEEVCSDAKVIAMWGASQVNKYKDIWMMRL